MRILVLGADGYLGWPTAMKLSKAAHQVMAVDKDASRNRIKKARQEKRHGRLAGAGRSDKRHDLTQANGQIHFV